MRAQRRVMLPPELAALAADPIAREQIKREVKKRLDERKIELYRPYTKQEAFHAAGKAYRERLLMAGNQLGKTYSAAAETAYHLTGEYPSWWQGRRFDKAVAFWGAGVTNEATRDTVQRLLVGRAGNIGTGMIPKARIKETTSARGIADALDTVFVHHVSGGVSQITFKSYEEKREKWQGETLDGVWMDEEPPLPLYMEALTRTNATGGIVYCTFTPLLGMSDMVRLFYPRPSSVDRCIVQMTIMDADHLDEEQKQRIIASYPAHEREARTRGVPQLGSGKVFAVPESAYTMDAFAVPPHWPGIIGIDLGFDHPFGAALLRYDRDADTIYVTNTHREKNQTVLQQAEVLRAWRKYPVAWPHDAASHDRTSGETMAELYRRHGLNMLHAHATFPDGGYGLEASIADVTDRLETGRLKIFSHLADLLEELRMYHRKEGRVVKEQDDIISAVRYALMMLRFAGRPPSATGSGPPRRRLRLV